LSYSKQGRREQSMYLMYVDESGDCGLQRSPTRYFILTGLVVHELRWRSCLDELVNLRRNLRQNFGFKLREEFHASSMISHSGSITAIAIPRHRRLIMIREFADAISHIGDITLINVLVDKQTKTQGYDVFSTAWKALIQRFENTIRSRNFPGPANPDDRGFILCDHTDDKKLMSILRKMHHYNPVPQGEAYGGGFRNLPIQYVIEDPSFRDSAHSFFIQAVDLAAYLLYQYTFPNRYMRTKGGHHYFRRLRPILCLVAAPRDPDGIVRL